MVVRTQKQILRPFGLASAALAFGLGAASPASSACLDQWTNPKALYGESIDFEVLRDGSPVGYHRVNFREEGSNVVIDSRFVVQVNILFIPAYRYEYASKEIWRDGCLAELRADTNDDGTQTSVRAQAAGDALRIVAPNGNETTSPRLFPTNHWNVGVLGSDQVLNTITGRVDDVRNIDRGEVAVTVNGQSRPARRYSYTGDLEVDVWYDSRGRWVKMRFRNDDGSVIEYVCRKCGLESAGQA